jgi:triacylglycerol esterase/lipase EstA (alpha/beta hydrolase family)
MSRLTILFPFVATSVLFLAACSSPTVITAENPFTSSPLMQALLNPGKLSPATEAFLKERDLVNAYKKDPAGTISTLRSHLGTNPSRSDRLALIELCSDTAENLAKTDPVRAAAYHLATAEIAFPVAMASTPSPEDPFVTAYNHSTGRVAQLLFDNKHDWSKTSTLEGPGKSYRLRCKTTGEGFVSPAFFDQLTPSEYLAFENIEVERIRLDGVGGSLVGHRDGSAERRKTDPFLPPSVGMSLPVNAILDFSRNGAEVELAFRDVLVQDTARVAGRERALSGDLTAPLVSLFKFRTVKNMGLKALMHPDEYLGQMGLLQLEPYRPGQIPVVFVHGLMSSPSTWVNALNKMRADPFIRNNYQLFAFRYPTGFPIARNAAVFRKHIADFQAHYDPDRQNPRMRNMLFIGHSMGGILTNAQIRDSEDTINSVLFDRPVDQLGNITPEEKQSILSMTSYTANPDITRVVFVASPHRGSEMSTGKLGSIGKKLIKLPKKVALAQQLLKIDGLTDNGRKIINTRPDSIGDLNPDAPILKAILDQPVRPGVKIHSIIGNHRMTSPLEDSSDTVVPYRSAHLDGAVSEKVVDAKHTTITHDPVAIEELRRILYLHLGKPYKAPPVAGRTPDAN